MRLQLTLLRDHLFPLFLGTPQAPLHLLHSALIVTQSHRYLAKTRPVLLHILLQLPTLHLQLVQLLFFLLPLVLHLLLLGPKLLLQLLLQAHKQPHFIVHVLLSIGSLVDLNLSFLYQRRPVLHLLHDIVDGALILVLIQHKLPLISC